MNFMIDFCFLLDIIVTFRVTYIDDFGQEVNEPRKIAFNYLKGQFWIDLVATIPLDQLIVMIFRSSNPIFQVFGILKLGRLLRLNKIIAYLNVIEDVKAMIKLIKMVFFLIIYMHLYACFWWMLVKNK